MGLGAYFAPTLAGKRCIFEVAPIDLYNTMLQVLIWGKGTGKAGKWEAHKKHRGKRQIDLSLLTCCEFQPGFCAQSCSLKYYLH